jgi:hypothetical protein
MTGINDLPDDVLARILHTASLPLAYPWDSTLAGVCAHWRRVCHGRRSRGWYLEHSSLR